MGCTYRTVVVIKHPANHRVSCHAWFFRLVSAHCVMNPHRCLRAFPFHPNLVLPRSLQLHLAGKVFAASLGCLVERCYHWTMWWEVSQVKTFCKYTKTSWSKLISTEEKFVSGDIFAQRSLWIQHKLFQESGLPKDQNSTERKWNKKTSGEGGLLK